MCSRGPGHADKGRPREVQGNAPALTPGRARRRYGRFPVRTHPGLTASTRGSRGVATASSGLTDRADAGRARRRSWRVDAPDNPDAQRGSPADTSRLCRSCSTRSGSDRSFGIGQRVCAGASADGDRAPMGAESGARPQCVGEVTLPAPLKWIASSIRTEIPRSRPKAEAHPQQCGTVPAVSPTAAFAPHKTARPTLKHASHGPMRRGSVGRRVPARACMQPGVTSTVTGSGKDARR